ncbi:AcrR family transcriptional regulator [Variovorax guangxiensis]|uniref:AcrR family transcriptional regulator n=2 Tax=Variovorax guangxiensis TaxID=1775474 RepID=A0A840G289_9BURK|nr:AcrR family transcriptional regulator [Variovorax guangxiensis]
MVIARLSRLRGQGMEQESRERLVGKATRLFSERGFHLVSVEEIVGGSDELRIAMHRHFPRKEDLVQAVLEQRSDDILDSIARRLEEIPDPAGKIKGVFDWHDDWFRTPGFAGCLFERALSEFGVHTKGISDVALRYRSTLKRQMAEMLRMLIPQAHAVRLALTYAMLLHGAGAAAQAHGNPEELVHDAWQAAKLLLDKTRQP